MRRVDNKFMTFGRFWRKKASRRASCLFGQVTRRWTRDRMAPSNSGPRPVLTVVGLKAFQTICSHTLVAMLNSGQHTFRKILRIQHIQERNSRSETIAFLE